MGEAARNAQQTADRAQSATPDTRLHSWKEIAAYLKRDVTTVRRWEKREGLPIHRHLHARRDSVYADVVEIDRWWEGRRNGLEENGALDPASNGNRTLSPAVAVAAAMRSAPLASSLAATFFVTTLALSIFLISREQSNASGGSAEVRFSVSPPQGTSFSSVSLSPDGRQLAFTAAPTSSGRGKPLLWIRSLGMLEPRSLPDTEDAAFPFWSPTSDAVGFFAGGRLWITGLAGGSPRFVAEAPNGRGGTWNRAGVILFAADRDGAILRISEKGGAVTPVTTVSNPNERGHLWPEFLPDGNQFLYLADSSVPEHHNVFIGALGREDRTAVVPLASSNASFGVNGYLFFARDRQLVAQRFDLRSLTLSGDPIAIADRIQSVVDHKTDFAVSANGVVTYRVMQDPATRLIWRDRTRPLSTLIGTPAEYTEPALSPDERRVAISLFDPRPSSRFGYGTGGVRSDIWILDRTTGAPSQFTTDPAADWGAVWSPDGRTIVFSSNRREGNLELFQKAATGTDPSEIPLITQGMNPVAQSWSPDGKFILYCAFDAKTRMDLWLLPMSGDRTPVPLLRSEFSEMQGQISPDGRWFAYSSNESGRDEVYVQSFPKPGAKRQVSVSGGGDPRWRPDGKELYYITNDREFMAIPVKTGSLFEHGAAVTLFDTDVPPHWYYARNLYDVTRDGRFLFMKPIEDDRSSPFTIVLRWMPNRN